MRSFIKTALIAAVGAAVVTASPAFAAKAKRTQVYGAAPVYGSAVAPAPFVYDQGAFQIINEYLKDEPMHNGNAY